MKIVVYFENGKHSETVALFANEELYMACLPALEELAGGAGYVVTESVYEEDRIGE